MNTLRKGDRIQLTGTVVEVDTSVRVAFEGAENYGDHNHLARSVAARATILPRKLEVGMRVNSPNEGPGKILAIDDGLAWVKFDHDRGTNTFPISRLTPIDSDEPSDDGKGAER